MPGNITDVMTLENTIKTLDLLGQDKLHFILDRGFYSDDNIDAMLSKRHRFTVMVPTSRLWVRNAIDQHYESVKSKDFKDLVRFFVMASKVKFVFPIECS
jgi:transposase